MAGGLKGETFTFGVMDTVGEALGLLTRKRAFFLLETGGRPPEPKQGRDGECGFPLVLRGRGDPDARGLLFLLGEKRTRAGAAAKVIESEKPTRHRIGEALSDVSNMERISLFDLRDKYGGGALEARIWAGSEGEANDFWLREMLRLGRDPGKWYLSDDYSSVKVRLRRIAEGRGEGPGNGGEGGAQAADMADFEVYDRLSGKLAGEAVTEGVGYGDDVFVEYSVSSAAGKARYCATEFYSNHGWCEDPANLLVVRFTAEVLPGPCGLAEARSAHPSKLTARKSTGERFLVDSIAMENRVSAKFSSGDGPGVLSPGESASADRVMDNPVDFNLWVDMHRKEIELV